MEKNIYLKIQNVKEKLLKENIKKSGKNKFAGYDYYELADFTPSIIKFCNEERLFTRISFDKELATLEIIDIDKPEDKISYTSPMEELELKGCNKIQALGGTETYSRRYLYMVAFDIIENDMFDSTTTEDKPKTTSLVTENQKAMIKNLYTPEEIKEELSTLRRTKLSELTIQEASSLIGRKKLED